MLAKLRSFLGKDCDNFDIKCKSFNAISFVLFVISFVAFVILVIKNIYFNGNNFVIDVARLLFVSIFAGIAFYTHRKGYIIFSKYILVFSLLFFLVYYSVIINVYDPYIGVLSPIFILMISVISQIIFYFTKEKYHYYFIMILLLVNILFFGNIYDCYFPEIGIIESWGNVYVEVIVGLLFVYVIVNTIVYYILKKYKRTQVIIKTKNEQIIQNNIELKERNQELKEMKSELMAQNEELKVLDSTKDMFLSVISHDLKNSFNIVNGFSELLQLDYDDYDDTKRKYFIKEINTSSNLVFNLLENLLNWSNVKLNGINSSVEIVNLKEFITGTIETYNIVAKTKNIIIISENIPSEDIKVDKYVITTVLGNFINNAIKFSHKNSKIEIFTRLSENTIQFTVKDYGVGMDENTKNNLFTIGSNISTKGTDNERGTGLGLILCNEIILESDGKIWVESEINNGSSFHFSVNIQQPD